MDVTTIVVGFDGSANAQSALEAAADIVASDGVVHVVTAYHMPSPREAEASWASVPAPSRDRFSLLAEPRSHLKGAETFLESQGIDHMGHFVSDPTGQGDPRRRRGPDHCR